MAGQNFEFVCFSLKFLSHKFTFISFCSPASRLMLLFLRSELEVLMIPPISSGMWIV